MLDLLMSVLTGGATGLLGSVISKVFNIFEARERRRDRLLEYEHERSLLQMQAQLRQGEREHEMAIAQEASWGQVRSASYEHDESYGSNHLLAWMRLVRPVLTFLLIGLTAAIFFASGDGGTRAEIAGQVTFMMAMAMSWWFGDRSALGGRARP